ncbi:hypothetical protein CR513_29975, partial [Mucuna pruriens]
MTRSSTDSLYAFDPEIELTLRRLRKIRPLYSLDSTINSNHLYTDNLVSSSNILAELGHMENNNRTLKELATPDVPVLFNTWGDMKRTFLEKFFPASRTASIRKEICGIRQHTGETLHEYWERFNKLCATCPHHQISEQLLIQYFYEGLLMMDRSMIDAANGGALMDKTPTAARHLISNMASNTYFQPETGELADRIDIIVGQHQPALAAKLCGICTSVEHPTDMCPTLQETESDQPKNYGKQPYQNHPFDSQQHGRQPFQLGPNQGPYAAQQFGSTLNAYQRQAGYQQPTPKYQAPPFQQQQQQQRVPTQGSSPSLEDLMKQLATSNLEFQQFFQQNMTATIQDLKTQIG